MFAVGLILGLVLGCFLGLMIMACLRAGGDEK